MTEAGPAVGVWPDGWIHGHRRGAPDHDPPIQVHAWDDRTVVLRQSMAVHFEAPFLFLLFGERRALLLDTGATEDAGRFPLRTTVDRLIDAWLERHPTDGYELVVAHSHAHGDHVAADPQFADRPRTTVIGHDVEAVRAAFGIDPWPAGEGSLELGGRRLAVTGIPGHHPASIAILDPWTGWLLTGDTVYPGRLYVDDLPAFVDSLDRLVAWADERAVTAVVGCHIELSTTPGRDHPLGYPYHPDDPPLAMTVEQLRHLRDVARTVPDRTGVTDAGDALIWVGRPLGAMVRQVGRGLSARIRGG
jgi:glyoxylase-like metal-dependent hydrolase (beta-lactamase superfamily II)